MRNSANKVRQTFGIYNHAEFGELYIHSEVLLFFLAGLIPSGPERNLVKPLWSPDGSTGGLNFRFLKRGEPEIDVRTSSSGREMTFSPNHSEVLLIKLLYMYQATCHVATVQF